VARRPLLCIFPLSFTAPHFGLYRIWSVPHFGLFVHKNLSAKTSAASIDILLRSVRCPIECESLHHWTPAKSAAVVHCGVEKKGKEGLFMQKRFLAHF
jgi:hypothetical protein